MDPNEPAKPAFRPKLTPDNSRRTVRVMRLFLAGFLILILPAAVFAQVTGQVLSIGFDNRYRPDCWTPMLVQLTNTSEQSAEYQIQIVQEDLDRDHAIYTQQVTVSSGADGHPATENFWVYFRPKPTDSGLPDATDSSTNLRTLNG